MPIQYLNYEVLFHNQGGYHNGQILQALSLPPLASEWHLTAFQWFPFWLDIKFWLYKVSF